MAAAFPPNVKPGVAEGWEGVVDVIVPNGTPGMEAGGACAGCVEPKEKPLVVGAEGCAAAPKENAGFGFSGPVATFVFSSEVVCPPNAGVAGVLKFGVCVAPNDKAGVVCFVSSAGFVAPKEKVGFVASAAGGGALPNENNPVVSFVFGAGVD